MNLDVNQISLISTCAGCLSSDRKLTQLPNKAKKVFLKLLDTFETISREVQLCWECTALLGKLHHFQRQVQTAQENLHRHASHLTPLSRLKRSKIQTCSVADGSKDSGTAQYSTRSKNNKLTHNIPGNVKYECNIDKYNIESNNAVKRDINYRASDGIVSKTIDKCSKELSDKLTHEKCPSNDRVSCINDSKLGSNSVKSNADVAPLTFIKVEESENGDFNDESMSYIEDNGFHVVEFEDKHLEGGKSFVCDDRGVELNGTKHKTDLEDFNDSDDEPLTMKQTEKRTRKRKKKERGEKASGSKRSGGRRERAAGVVESARVANKLQQLNVPPGLLQMVLLSWEEVEEERQRALASAAYTRQAYRCGDCALGFNHKVKLENHLKKHDPVSGPEQCSVCRVRCRDTHALAAHRRRHRVRWSCLRCGGRWSRAAVAADHAARSHGAPLPQHACPHCAHRAPTLAKLRNHLKSHSARQDCQLCGKTFRDRTSLRTHLFIHGGEKEYGCPECPKRFLFKKAMEVHLVTHDKPALLYCHQCDMNFKNQMSFYQHMKYNLRHIDPAKLKFACPLCEKRFAKAARLHEHNLAVHLKSTPIRCAAPGCTFACSSRPVLRSHARAVHRGGRAPRNHVCHACGKAYTTKKTLEGHIRTHTGERPFKCSQCPSTFGYEAALYNHNKLVHLKPKAGRGRDVTNPSSANQPPVALTVPAAVALAVPHPDPDAGAAPAFY